MRVVLASYATGGGVRRSQAKLADALAGEGVKVLLLSPLAGAPFFDEVSPAVERARLSAQPWPVSTAISLRSALRDFRATHLVASQDQTIVPAAMLSATGQMPCPWIAKVHNNPVVHKRATNPLARLLGYTPRFTYRRADMVVAVSHELRDLLVRQGLADERTSTSVWNPIAPVEKDYSDSGALVTDKPFLLNVGNMNRQKNQRVLLDAFALVAGEYAGDLVILGEGPLRPELEDQARRLGIAERVHMPGFADPHPYFANADAFVLSSSWEGMPLVPVEALAHGCPVVSTDCDYGPREILDHGKYGRLCALEDPDALARGISEVLADPPEKSRLIERSREWLPENCARAFISLLERLDDPRAVRT